MRTVRPAETDDAIAACTDLARRIADARSRRRTPIPVATAEQLAGSTYLGGMTDDEAWATFAPKTAGRP